MSDAVEHPDRPALTRQLAAQAIVDYFLANAETGNHAANDELIAALALRQRRRRQNGVVSTLL